MPKDKISTSVIHFEPNIVNIGRKNYGVPVLDGSTIFFDKYENFVSSPINEQTADLHRITHSLQNYGRGGNETTLAVEQMIAKLENADMCKLFPCGLAAIRASLMGFLSSGSHLLANDEIYAPVKMLIEGTLANFGVEVTYFDPMVSKDELMSLVRPNTKVIYLETPNTRFFEVSDVGAIVEVAKKIGAVTICDNSYSTFLNFKPLDAGMDVSISSLTKYAAGHSDMLSGSVCVKEKHFRRLFEVVDESGDHVPATSSANLLKGMRTLEFRMNHSISVGQKFIDYLQKNKKIAKIYHPTQKDHLGHDNFIKYFKNAPSLMSIALDRRYSDKELSAMFDSFKLFGMGYSYGGLESLAIPIPTQNARNYSKNKPIDHSSIRIYVGFEAFDDLLEDFDNALSKL